MDRNPIRFGLEDSIDSPLWTRPPSRPAATIPTVHRIRGTQEEEDEANEWQHSRRREEARDSSATVDNAEASSWQKSQHRARHTLSAWIPGRNSRNHQCPLATYPAISSHLALGTNASAWSGEAPFDIKLDPWLPVTAGLVAFWQGTQSRVIQRCSRNTTSKWHSVLVRSV